MFASGTAGVSITSLFVKPVTEEFGWSRGLISGAISLGTLMGGLVAPFIGRIIDQKGPRVILTIGCLMQGISLIGLSMTRNIWSLYLCICLARVNFSSLVIVGAPTAVSNWFVAKRAKLLSLLIIDETDNSEFFLYKFNMSNEAKLRINLQSFFDVMKAHLNNPPLNNNCLFL